VFVVSLALELAFKTHERFGKRHVPSEDCPPNCFGCKAAGVSFSAAATPFLKAKVMQSSQLEKDYAKNAPAYKRFRQAGLQPKSVMMAKQLEDHANSQFEVESGHRLSSAKVGAKYDEAQKFLKKEGGIQPLKRA
jgi:hypothetical protein